MFTSVVLSICLSQAMPTPKVGTVTRDIEIPNKISHAVSLQVKMKSVDLSNNTVQMMGACPEQEVTLTDSDFEPGTYVLQAGFEEGESLGAEYAVPSIEFPIRVDRMEVMFATSNATVTTTTKWAVTVWDGTPMEGIQVASFASDGDIIPHLVMPPGTSGTIIQVVVDPDDPEQIYVYNDSGMNSYSVTFSIVEHNSPGNPCLSAPPSYANAFPCTDTGGLQFPSENLINAIDGTLCVCGSGWFTFASFPNICTPSGDWVIRSAYTPINCSGDIAACCFENETCMDLTPIECASFGGESQDSWTSCNTTSCLSGVGACCIPSTDNCVQFDESQCETVGGVYMGESTNCSNIDCFPEGACCLPNGSCIGPISPDECAVVDGVFSGNDTNCANESCPQPLGACCGDPWCLDITESDCSAVGGSWSGALTTCNNIDCSSCTEDINGDGQINVSDLLVVVSFWGTSNSGADIDGSGTVDMPDLLAIIGSWGNCE